MPKQEVMHSCPFDEIFDFAKEHYGIEWNPANDLFFQRGVLHYRSMNKHNAGDLVDGVDYLYNEATRIFNEQFPDHDHDSCQDTIDFGKGNYHKHWQIMQEFPVQDIPKEIMDSLDDRTRAQLIILHFMQHHKITGTLLVDNT